MLASVGQEQASTDCGVNSTLQISELTVPCCVTRYPNVIFAAIHRTLDHRLTTPSETQMEPRARNWSQGQEPGQPWTAWTLARHIWSEAVL